MAPPTGPIATAAATTLTAKDIIAIVRRHIWLIISLAILGFIFGGIGWFLMMRYLPKYTAQTFIRILPPAEKDPTRIGGIQVQKEIQFGYRMSMASLITQQSNLQALLDRDKIQETKWFQNLGKIKDKRIRKGVKKLKKKLGAYAQRDGEFVVVSMACGDPEESALIVNEMVDLFVSSRSITKKDEVSAKLAGLRKQLDSTQNELVYADRMLDEVRTSTKFTDLEQRNFRSTIEEKLGRLELDQAELEQDMRQIQSSIGILEKQALGPIDEQVENEVERDPTMIMLTQQLAMRESALAGSLTKFGENHPVVKKFQETVNELRIKKQLRKAEISALTRQANLIGAQNQLIVMQDNLTILERMRQQAAAKKADLDLARVLYTRRLAVRDEIKDRLNNLKEQIGKRTIMHDDPETPKVQKVGLAPVPMEVSSPLWYVYFPAGTMLGLMLGAGLAFMIELLNDLVRTPRDVSRYLRVPLLGIIPDANADGQLDDVDLTHVVRLSPYSIISESYRRFRTNLKLSASAETSKALLIASGMAGDGRTSVAVNLATSFVAENRKVLLIDANFWRPSLHRAFPKIEDNENNDQMGEFGLSTMLTGLCGYQEIIRPTGIEGFDIIESGMLPSNPAELLGSPRMQQLIKQQQQNYDYVIVDGPPVLLVSDAKVLAKFVDGIVLVLNAATTKRGTAIRTIKEFREVDATIFGSVLFGVKALKGGYFSEQFKSYQKYQQLQLEQV